MDNEQIEIMRHTARNGRFNGDGPEMQALVAAGLMQCLGKPAWTPSPYFGLTPAGREWLRLNPPKEISRR